MRCLKLWTVRPESDFFLLQKQGVYRTDKRFVFPHRHKAYHWIAEQLKKKISPPDGVDFPVWAWYRAYGLNQIKPDLRKSGHLKRKERGVRIEFDVPEHLVLLSHFDAWHAVLNNHCLAFTDKELDEYEQMEQTYPKDIFEKIKQTSWIKIFDLDLIEDPNNDSVQAILWELKMEWVKKVDFFTAR